MTSPAQPGGASLAGARIGDRVFKAVLTAAALAVPVLMGFLVWELWSGARLAIGEFGFGFVTSSDWDPVAGQFGALPLIFGTLLSSLWPCSSRCRSRSASRSILTEFAPTRIRQPIAFLIELLAAIPSVVYGLWGIFVLIPFLRVTLSLPPDTLGFLPFFQGPIYGPSMLAAGIILAIMIMPYIMSVSRRGAAGGPEQPAGGGAGAGRHALGGGDSAAVLPYARSGIIGAIILGLGRALGETMAVTMVIGNRHEIAASLFAPGYTMAAVIANEFSEAVENIHLSALWPTWRFTLFVVTVLVNAAARLLIWRVAAGRRREARA